MACNCNYLLFFVWLLIVKTGKHILLLWLCDYVTITQYHCIMIGQQKNNITLYHQNWYLMEKPTLIFFFNTDSYKIILKLFEKYKCSGIASISSRILDMFLMSSHI